MEATVVAQDTSRQSVMLMDDVGRVAFLVAALTLTTEACSWQVDDALRCHLCDNFCFNHIRNSSRLYSREQVTGEMCDYCCFRHRTASHSNDMFVISDDIVSHHHSLPNHVGYYTFVSPLRARGDLDAPSRRSEGLPKRYK